MSDIVLLPRDGAIATVVLNKPQKLNALEIFLEGRVFDAIEAKEKASGQSRRRR
jgi:enoyl-CoA hydratase/carnithine racemase